ncbi:MAG: hypothetical protein ABI477_11480 [Chryseolinea sp.]
MKKVLIGFFLTLSVLLLSRYSQLYAQLDALQYTYCSDDTRLENLKRSEHATFDKEYANEASFFMFASADTQKAKYKIDDATEVREEDDEFGSSKKYVRSTDCVVNIYSTFSEVDCFHRAASGLSYARHFSHVTSGRSYITLRVIRI